MKKLISIFVLVALVFSLAGCAAMDYKKAMGLYESGKYAEALAIFQDLGDHENSAEMVKACSYEIAAQYLADGEYQKAADGFAALGDYKDSAAKAVTCQEELIHDTLEGVWSYTLSSSNVSLTISLTFNHGEVDSKMSSGTSSIGNHGNYTLDITNKTILITYDNGNKATFVYSFENGVYTVSSDSLTLTKE